MEDEDGCNWVVATGADVGDTLDVTAEVDGIEEEGVL